jgi:signal transduction histidine kinase
MIQIFVILVLAIVIAFLSTRLYLINKNLHIFKSELESFDGKDYRKNLTLICNNKAMEELAVSINKKTGQMKAAIDHYRAMENEMGQSIADMSHDLRTPLTAIIGYIQLMKGETDIAEAKKYADIAERRAKTLQTLINGFFEISLIESSEYPIAIEAVDLSAVLAQYIVDLYNNLKTSGLKLDVNIPERPVKILADKNALNRIIDNLLGNALQHSIADLSIKLYEEGKSACLEISNYADNLSEKDVQMLFDRFYSADKVRNEQRKGLGLSIVKTLIEKLEGTINADYKGNVLTIKAVFKKSN